MKDEKPVLLECDPYSSIRMELFNRTVSVNEFFITYQMKTRKRDNATKAGLNGACRNCRIKKKQSS